MGVRKQHGKLYFAGEEEVVTVTRAAREVGVLAKNDTLKGTDLFSQRWDVRRRLDPRRADCGIVLGHEPLPQL